MPTTPPNQQSETPRTDELLRVQFFEANKHFEWEETNEPSEFPSHHFDLPKLMAIELTAAKAEVEELRQRFIKDHLPEEFESWEQVWKERVRITREVLDLKQDRDDWRKRLETCMDGLLDFGRHKNGCKYFQFPVGAEPCNCGLNSTITQLSQRKDK